MVYSSTAFYILYHISLGSLPSLLTCPFQLDILSNYLHPGSASVNVQIPDTPVSILVYTPVVNLCIRFSAGVPVSSSFIVLSGVYPLSRFLTLKPSSCFLSCCFLAHSPSSFFSLLCALFVVRSLSFRLNMSHTRSVETGHFPFVETAHVISISCIVSEHSFPTVETRHF